MIENDLQLEIIKEDIQKFEDAIIEMNNASPQKAIYRAMKRTLLSQQSDLIKEVEEYNKKRFIYICPFCDIKLKRETRTIKREYKGVEYTINQPGEWCDKCNEGFFHLEDLKATREERDRKKGEIEEKIYEGK